MNEPLVATDLVVEYDTDHGVQRALDGATLSISPASIIGLVGESGSGKSTFGLAAGRLLPPTARRVAGDLLVDGHAVFDLPLHAVGQLRRSTLAFIFQDPLGSLDPTMRVGRQLALALADAEDAGSPAAHLARVGLDGSVARRFPHELSGGMAQRVAFAIAHARRARLIIADEPTASLDATIRRQAMDLLMGLARAAGSSVLLLTHDLRSVRRYCSRVAVMYGGRIVEDGPTARVFERPLHPYTRSLLRAAVGRERIGGDVVPIAGMPPTLHGAAAGCSFAPRCEWVQSRCLIERPASEIHDERVLLCHRAAESRVGALKERVRVDA